MPRIRTETFAPPVEWSMVIDWSDSERIVVTLEQPGKVSHVGTFFTLEQAIPWAVRYITSRGFDMGIPSLMDAKRRRQHWIRLDAITPNTG